jgi:N-methylhydantoinase A
MSYGGAGPFHAVGYAQSIGINSIVVPGEAASVWSAFGISQADVRYQYEASVVMLEPFSAAGVEQVFAGLESAARAALSAREDVARFEFRRYARMRFQWQMHELEMRLADGPITEELVERISREFVAMYAERYGEAALLPGARLEIGSLRLEPAIAMGSLTLDRLKMDDRLFHQGTRPLYFERGAGSVEGDIYNGHAMPVGDPVEGPAIIDLAITGIVLPPGTSCERRRTGDFVINLNPS